MLLLTTKLVALLLCLVTHHCAVDGQVEEFTQQPQDAVVSQGQFEILQCSIQNCVGQVQWLRNGFGLGPGPTFDGYPRYKVLVNQALGEYNLQISNIQLEDDALFQCQVGATSSTPGLQSRQAKLTVQLPPDSVYVDGSPRLEVLLNTPFNVTCHADNGKPAPVLTWTSGGVVITDNVYHINAMNSDGKRENATSWITVTPSKDVQGQGYSCSAINSAMITPIAASVTIDVVYAPEVTMHSPPLPLVEFNNAIFTCTADSSLPITAWSWYVDSVLSAGASTGTMTIQSVGRALNRKVVLCQATNSVGNGAQSVVLVVNYGPQFTTEPVDQAADVGGSALLSCTVGGNPPPSITWTQPGSTVIFGSNSTLAISSVTDSSFGTYTCTASVSGFPAVSRNVRLLKNGPPTIISPSQQSVRYGDTGYVNCSAISIPKPASITWSVNGHALDLTQLPRYQIQLTNIHDGQSSVLQITNVQDSDFGVFNCTVDNGYGVVHLDITLSKTAVVQLAYILAGVFAGILLIIIISIVIFVCHRRRALGSELGSDSSEYHITKKKKVPTATLR